RLVQFVRERGRHLAKLIEAGEPSQFGLDFLQPRRPLLALSQVTDEPGEVDAASRLHLANGKLHRKGGAILPGSDDDSVDSDDTPLAGAQVALDMAIVFAPVWLRHKHAHVAADHLVLAVAKLAHGSRIEGNDRA